tara:strand:+ start:230 stop:1552 length:1323 start_codon:yes stop_codon:yes gene_type:complete
MAGKGLITVHRFLEKLVEEVDKIDIKEINSLIHQQQQADRFIAKMPTFFNKDYFSDPVVKNLENHVLPRKIELISIYSQRLQKIKRVIKILKKIDKGYDARAVRENNKLLELLEFAERFLKDNKLPRLLIKQLEALKKHKREAFLKIATKEYLMLRPLAKSLAKLDTRIDLETFNKLSIRGRVGVILNNLIAGFLLTGLFILNAGFANGQILTAMGGYKACQEYPTVARIRYDVFSTSELIKHYQKNDWKYELQIEGEFEMLTNVEVAGEYTKKDLILLKSILERTYGLKALRKYEIYNITIVPREVIMTHLGARPYSACAGFKLAGSASRTGEFLIRSTSFLGTSQFTKTFLHEFSHHIHFNVQKHHPDFDKKWNEIKGGYAREYGMNNIYEDVATVAEVASFARIEGKSLQSIRAVDGNQQALQQKINLLFEYGFFPD